MIYHLFCCNGRHYSKINFFFINNSVSIMWVYFRSVNSENQRQMLSTGLLLLNEERYLASLFSLRYRSSFGDGRGFIDI